MFSKWIYCAAMLFSNLCFAQSYHVADLQGLTSDFAAPVVPNTSAVADKSVGMIVYDASANSFKGLDSTGNWDSMTAAGANAVTSGASSDRIERALIVLTNSTTCSIASQSGTWISSVAASSSICTLTLPVGTFSAAPTCVATRNGNAAQVGTAFASAATSVSVALYDTATGAIQTSGFGLNVICMGPR